MKKSLLLSLCLLFLGIAAIEAQIKYVDDIYARSTVTRTNRVRYQYALAVLTGSAKLDSFYMDIYEPTGNTDAARPVIIYLHTGSFLPRYINKLPTGARDDSATVEMCTRFAQKGYVVASMSYRLGWNPQSQVENIRKGTIINAAYRGSQDLSTAIRFIKRNVATGGNTWKIDTTKICVGGQGTGGYITMAYASLDRQSEIKIDKFYDLDSSRYMVDDTLWGNLKGLKLHPTRSVACIENHKGYTSNARMAFNIGGAMGDTSWLEAGEMPIVSIHGIQDPFAPYKTGIVYVPGTVPPLTVVQVSGGYDIMKKVNKLNNNAVYKGKVHDWYTTRANQINDGLEGLFPIAGAANGSGPWEWWDTTRIRLILTASGQFTQPAITAINTNGYASNPFMSKTRALKYIDTLQGYLAPRIAVTLGLVSEVKTVNPKLESALAVYPNPSNGMVRIENTMAENKIEKIYIYDMNGRLLNSYAGNKSDINLGNQKGLYLITVQFQQGSVSRKIMVQ